MKSGYGYGLWHLTELWVFPVNGVGGCQNPWVFTVYGLSERWVMTESTVLPFKFEVFLFLLVRLTKPRRLARGLYCCLPIKRKILYIFNSFFATRLITRRWLWKLLIPMGHSHISIFRKSVCNKICIFILSTFCCKYILILCWFGHAPREILSFTAKLITPVTFSSRDVDHIVFPLP